MLLVRLALPALLALRVRQVTMEQQVLLVQRVPQVLRALLVQLALA